MKPPIKCQRVPARVPLSGAVHQSSHLLHALVQLVRQTWGSSPEGSLKYCFLNWGVLLASVPIRRALLFEVYVKDPVLDASCRKLECRSILGVVAMVLGRYLVLEYLDPYCRCRQQILLRGAWPHLVVSSSVFRYDGWVPASYGSKYSGRAPIT